MKFRFWQMWELPARQAGQVPSQSSGITVTASPAAHPVDAGPDRLDRAAHLVAEGQRAAHAGIHVAVQDVQVRAAEAGEGDRAPAPRRPGGAASALSMRIVRSPVYRAVSTGGILSPDVIQHIEPIYWRLISHIRANSRQSGVNTSNVCV